MKKLITLVFVCIAFIGFAQKGKFQILNMGNFYRVKMVEIPKPPMTSFDTKTMRVSVTCLNTMQTDITFDNVNSNVDYYLNGNNLIGVTICYYKSGKLVGSQSVPYSTCIFGLNPTACFKKL